MRRSLRSGWYLYGLFFPLREIPRRFLYTLWVQLKKKTFKGDVKATIGIFQALIDVLLHIPIINGTASSNVFILAIPHFGEETRHQCEFGNSFLRLSCKSELAY